VLRFVDAVSRYDLSRARTLEFPVEQYGTGFFRYKPITRQHIEIAEAGAENGDVLAQCCYFGERDRRMIRQDDDSCRPASLSWIRVVRVCRERLGFTINTTSMRIAVLSDGRAGVNRCTRPSKG